jgi:hypothetical protein
MNKNELNRLVTWRLKLLRQADEMPRGVAQTIIIGLTEPSMGRRLTSGSWPEKPLPGCHRSPETLQ